MSVCVFSSRMTMIASANEEFIGRLESGAGNSAGHGSGWECTEIGF